MWVVTGLRNSILFWDAEAGGFWLQGQSELHETLSQNKQTKSTHLKQKQKSKNKTKKKKEKEKTKKSLLLASEMHKSDILLVSL